MTTPAPAPDAEAAAAAYYVQQQRVGRDVAVQVQTAWQELDPNDPVGSWTSPGGVGDEVVEAVARGQHAAASAAGPYLDTVVAAEGLESDWQGRLRPGAWRGTTADGRLLSTLLFQPVSTVEMYVDRGMPARDALQRGLAELVRMAVSEVAGAGRSSAGAGIAANKTVTGYTRHLNPPSCARCIILAGKWYAWNQGFRRHPRCDCTHLPSSRARTDRTTDPAAYFRSLSRAEQDRIFTVGGARAIRDGGEITAVVNARRGIVETTVYGRRMRITLEGTTARGWFYRSELRLALERGQGPFHVRGRNDGLPRFDLRTPRLTPEEIYRIADDRDEALRLLRRHGYIR